MKKSLGAHTYLPTTPILLIGTYDKSGKANLMTAAWGGICCSKPPCIAVSLRKATYTYGALLERRAFTVGIPMAGQVKEADFFGLVSGHTANKLKEAEFTARKSELVDAPYAEEIPFVLECRLSKSIELGLHTMFIGEIIDVKADDTILSEDGLPDITKIQPFIFDSVHRGYYQVGQFLGAAFSIGKK